MRSIATALCLLSGAAVAATTLGIHATYTLGGSGGWDYLTLDATAARLFIARADRVMVVSAADGRLLGTIPHTEGVHGVALAPDLGRGFISDGRADAVTVFDLRTLETVATWPVSGHNPDAIVYDAASRHLITFNGRSHDITVLDPANGTLVATLAVGGKPEFAQADGKGHVYFNIEDTAELSELDALTNRLIATWKLPDCEEPTGLAFDIAHLRLFSGCGNGKLVVTDAHTGRHVATVPIGQGSDAVTFDAERRQVFSTNGEDGTLTVIHADSPDQYSVVATVPTQKSARTMALDTATHRIYTVAAEFGPTPAPTPDQPHPRAPVRDGSFRVLVLGE
jgi:DNA-binding beta-propeller fold protein YncE